MAVDATHSGKIQPSLHPEISPPTPSLSSPVGQFTVSTITAKKQTNCLRDFFCFICCNRINEETNAQQKQANIKHFEHQGVI